MIEIHIPGTGCLKLEYLVLDYNGTIAIDGKVISGVKERIVELSKVLKVYVLTADTFGSVERNLAGIPCSVRVLPDGSSHTEGKATFVMKLGSEKTVAIGNGRNDLKMIEKAALGIVVVQAEGASGRTIMAADIIVPDILSALDLLINPLRIVATLRQ